jgi:membrane peptidoglycan carboxypeptidase
MLSDRLRESVRTHPRIFVTTVLAISAFLWTGVAAFALLIGNVVTDLPDQATLRTIGTLTGSTELLDMRGRTISAISKVQRIEVPLDRVSPNIVRAIVAVEDQRFYDHRGIDLVRIGGALVQNILEVRVAQGGSTITQQLIRQRFLGREKTLVRKTKEALLAVRLEEEASKEEILQLYLNTVLLACGLDTTSLAR